MSALLVALSQVNSAVLKPLDSPYTSLPVMSVPADTTATLEALLPYARLLCFLIAGLVLVLRKSPQQPDALHRLFIHRTREHHMATAAYDARTHSTPTCAVCEKPFTEQSSVATLHCQHCAHPACLSAWLDDSRACPTCGEAVAEQLVWPFDSWLYAVPFWLRDAVCAHHRWLDALFVAASAALLLLELALCVVGEGSATGLLLEALTLRHGYHLWR